MGSFLCALLQVYSVVLLLRVVMSWFPMRPGTGLASGVSILYDLTEPVLAPIRRLLPSTGVIDISPLIVFLLLEILRTRICTGGLF